MQGILQVPSAKLKSKPMFFWYQKNETLTRPRRKKRIKTHHGCSFNLLSVLGGVFLGEEIKSGEFELSVVKLTHHSQKEREWEERESGAWREWLKFK